MIPSNHAYELAAHFDVCPTCKTIDTKQPAQFGRACTVGAALLKNYAGDVRRYVRTHRKGKR